MEAASCSVYCILHWILGKLTLNSVWFCSISTVYKAVCIENQQTVIIKIYDKGKMKLKNTLRMEREIRLMKMLTGPGMVSLYGVFEDDARKSLVMEYCSGGDLFKYLLLRGGHLDEHWVCTEVYYSKAGTYDGWLLADSSLVKAFSPSRELSGNTPDPMWLACLRITGKRDAQHAA